MEMIFLPAQNKIFALTGADQVAFFDLSAKRVSQVVSTGRGGSKFRAMLGASVRAGLANSLNDLQNRSVPSYYSQVGMEQFMPRLGSETLAASPDGETVYALNTISRDVTVIGTGDALVREMIPMAGASRLYGFQGQQFVAIDSDKGARWLDAKSAKLTDPIDGALLSVVQDAGNSRMIVLTTSGAFVRDGSLDASLRPLARTEGMLRIFWQ